MGVSQELLVSHGQGMETEGCWGLQQDRLSTEVVEYPGLLKQWMSGAHNELFSLWPASLTSLYLSCKTGLLLFPLRVGFFEAEGKEVSSPSFWTCVIVMAWRPVLHHSSREHKK